MVFPVARNKPEWAFPPEGQPSAIRTREPSYRVDTVQVHKGYKVQTDNAKNNPTHYQE